jgi:two-component system CheB/CheR fusion protein
MPFTKKSKSKTSKATTNIKKTRLQESPLKEKKVELQDTAGKQIPVFPVVGICASAGGLAAFEAFFSGMPAGTEPGMAFVLVQHLTPDHKSLLAEIIRRYTRMKVFEVEDGMKVQPNRAYIIPHQLRHGFSERCAPAHETVRTARAAISDRLLFPFIGAGSA